MNKSVFVKYITGGNQGWNQNGPSNYNPNPQNYQNHPGSQGGGNSNWGNNESFGCNYQQGFGGGPMRSNYNNQRSNPYGNSNNCPPNNYSFGECEKQNRCKKLQFKVMRM